MPFETRDYNRQGGGFEPRLNFGGPGGFSGWSVNTWLIVLCVAVFFVDALTARMMARHYTQGGLLSAWGAFSAADAVFRGQVWRLVTFQFLHGGLLHLLGNMLMLFFLGRWVEQYLGSRRYLAYYLLTGVAGAFTYLALLGLGRLFGYERVPFLLAGGADTRLVGASAGVFGVLVALLVIAPNRQIMLLFPPIPLKVSVLVWGLLLLNIFWVMTDPGAGGEAAHLGGAAVGFVLMRNVRWLAWADRARAPDVKQKVRAAKRERARRKEADFDAEIDRILEKVSREGLQSLTAGEKKLLRRDTDRKRRAG